MDAFWSSHGTGSYAVTAAQWVLRRIVRMRLTLGAYW